jgi:hypothetical protein
VRARLLIWPAAGFLVWSLAFVVLYGALSVGCAYRWDAIMVAGPLSLQFLAFLALGTAALRAAARRRDGAAGPAAGFTFEVAYFSALAALVSTAFTFFGVIFLSTCA